MISDILIEQPSCVESIILSAGGAESVMLSALALKVAILSVRAESINSQRCPLRV
jgi:hypothetical protein